MTPERDQIRLNGRLWIERLHASGLQMGVNLLGAPSMSSWCCAALIREAHASAYTNIVSLHMNDTQHLFPPSLLTYLFNMLAPDGIARQWQWYLKRSCLQRNDASPHSLDESTCRPCSLWWQAIRSTLVHFVKYQSSGMSLLSITRRV